LLANGFGIIALSVLNLVLSLANAALVVHYCRVFLPDLPLRPAPLIREEVLKLFNYGKYVLLSNIGDKIVFATDAVVIGIFLPIEALTPFAIGGTLIGHMRSVVMAMAQVFNPLASSMRAAGDEQAPQRLVQAGGKWAVIVGLPLCVGFITLGEPFVRLWIGDAHAPIAGQVLTALAVGYIIGLPYYTISGVLYGLGQHRMIAILRVVEGLMNLGLSIALVKVMGVVGVAIGTAVPHMIMVGWILPATLPRSFPLNLRDYYAAVYGRTLPSALPFLVTTWLIRAFVQPPTMLSFFAWGAVSLIAYIVPIWLVAMNHEERARMLRVTRLDAMIGRSVKGRALDRPAPAEGEIK
jgi:O-antigen/teichoic acid export membrane protein